MATLDLVKTDGDERNPLITGLDYMSDGRIAAVDNYNKKCFIMNAELQRQGSAFKYEWYPHNVSCYKESALAVTLGYVQKIHISLVEIILLKLSKIYLVDAFGYLCPAVIIRI